MKTTPFAAALAAGILTAAPLAADLLAIVEEYRDAPSISAPGPLDAAQSDLGPRDLTPFDPGVSIQDLALTEQRPAALSTTAMLVLINERPAQRKPPPFGLLAVWVIGWALAGGVLYRHSAVWPRRRRRPAVYSREWLAR